MTAEHVTLLEPNDFRAVRFVCKHCRSAVCIQLNETIRLPDRCPACHKEWGEAYGESPATIAHRLATSVKHWVAIERDKQPPFSVYFEISEKP